MARGLAKGIGVVPDMALRYDNRSVPGGAGYAHVYAREGEDVRIDLNFFEGDRSLPEALALHECLGAALDDAQQHVLGEPLNIEESLLTPDEQKNWARLEKQKQVLEKRAQSVKTSLEALFTTAFTRVLSEGVWEVHASGDGALYARPVERETERRLTRLAQETRLRGWHDSLCIEGGGTYLTVDFDDNNVSVRLEFTSEDPSQVARFGEALHMNLDLGGWAASRKAEMMTNIDRQVEALQARRGRIAGG